MNKSKNWYRDAVVYQIYPRSFYDTSSSGIGNINGITAKLDYLKGGPEGLGIDAIWISPIFTSPMADFGYDVANYTDIDPIFGTIKDFKNLLEQAHARNIRVILDFVPNHTSDKHPWFIESASTRDNPKRDWYTWRDPAVDNGPPNNWLSYFRGSAWQYSEATGQYYLHSFLTKQADLNWDNPEVREAMKQAMRFWLDMGVDGFRVDAVDGLSKDAELRDEPLAPYHDPAVRPYNYTDLLHPFSRDGPHLYERLNEMASVMAEYDNRFMINEAHPKGDDIVVGYAEYYAAIDPDNSAPFNFQCIYLPWQANAFRSYIDHFQSTMLPNYTPIYTLGNHDEPRLASRIGIPATRTAAMLLLTLPGMPFMYYGDEIGIENVAIFPDQVRDPFAEPGKGRDPERTPMQWDASANAGFTNGQPWLPVAADYAERNVAVQLANNASLLHLYKSLLKFRKSSVALREGSYQSIDCGEQIFGYIRKNESHSLVILLNFSDQAQPLPESLQLEEIMLSTISNRSIQNSAWLEPHEGQIRGLKLSDFNC
ncbi:alpha-amylase [Candidatus Saccharibacteria bacterium]|nr:alpha-amylase [Candidatus Saccharibacteria bacterium]